MATLADLREGFAANLASLKGVQVSAYELSNATLPAIWPKVAASDTGIEYYRSMANGVEQWTFWVECYVSSGASSVGAQKLLDGFLASTGSTSVKAAIESDTSLGGSAESLVVQSCSGPQNYVRADGSTALGARWTVLVITSGI